MRQLVRELAGRHRGERGASPCAVARRKAARRCGDKKQSERLPEVGLPLDHWRFRYSYGANWKLVSIWRRQISDEPGQEQLLRIKKLLAGELDIEI